ncbi:YigZ family protein [Aeromonas simiae]|uniref:YigZ family protein n=1 Tax=Aeromonas simiae TaxID=218936 RepID=UPI00266BE64D|nr:YigZ family protein [Aeromonas simiae]MDO2950088.1 YigZ family protein [Aeromonas simiae]MDO2953798.1 YigZ family protein [Aeromonas simiae]MDO2957491.1 YigZ family protein [Aeromonas simiae]
MSGYPIPAEAVEWSEEIKKSRFITLLRQVSSPEQAKAWIAEVRAAHPAARHHCWAFVAGAPDDSQAYGFSDDGEPSGTAGKPMLAQLMGSGIGEIGAVVVRYYGGVLLGTGGLVKAYGGGVGAALKRLPVATKRYMVSTFLECDYGDLGTIEHLQGLYEGVTEAADYGARVGLRIRWPKEHLSSVQALACERSQGRIMLRPTDA